MRSLTGKCRGNSSAKVLSPSNSVEGKTNRALPELGIHQRVPTSLEHHRKRSSAEALKDHTNFIASAGNNPANESFDITPTKSNQAATSISPKKKIMKPDTIGLSKNPMILNTMPVMKKVEENREPSLTTDERQQPKIIAGLGDFPTVNKELHEFTEMEASPSPYEIGEDFSGLSSIEGFQLPSLSSDQGSCQSLTYPPDNDREEVKHEGKEQADLASFLVPDPPQMRNQNGPEPKHHSTLQIDDLLTLVQNDLKNPSAWSDNADKKKLDQTPDIFDELEAILSVKRSKLVRQEAENLNGIKFVAPSTVCSRENTAFQQTKSQHMDGQIPDFHYSTVTPGSLFPQVCVDMDQANLMGSYQQFLQNGIARRANVQFPAVVNTGVDDILSSIAAPVSQGTTRDPNYGIPSPKTVSDHKRIS